MASALRIKVCVRNHTNGELSHSKFTVKPPDSVVEFDRNSFNSRPFQMSPFEFKPLWDINHVEIMCDSGGPQFFVNDDAFVDEFPILLPSGVPVKWSPHRISIDFNFDPDDCVQQRDPESYKLPEEFFENHTTEGKFVRRSLDRTVRKYAFGYYGATEYNDKARQLYFKANPLVIPVPSVDSDESHPCNPAAFLQHFPEGIKDFCCNPTSKGALESIGRQVNNEGNSITFVISDRTVKKLPDGERMVFDIKEDIETVDGRFKTLGLVFGALGVVSMSSPQETLRFRKLVVDGICDNRVRHVADCVLRSTPMLRSLKLSGFHRLLSKVIDGILMEHQQGIEKLKLIQTDYCDWGSYNLFHCVNFSRFQLKKLTVLTHHCPATASVRDTLRQFKDSLEAFTFGTTSNYNPTFASEDVHRIFPHGMRSLTSLSVVKIGSVAQVVLNATKLRRLRRLSIALGSYRVCCLDWKKALRISPFITPKPSGVVVLELNRALLLSLFSEVQEFFPAVKYLKAGGGVTDEFEELLSLNWKLRALEFVIECPHERRRASHSCQLDFLLGRMGHHKDPIGNLVYEGLEILKIGARNVTVAGGTFDIISGAGWRNGIENFINLKFLEIEGVPREWRRVWTQQMWRQGTEAELYEHPRRELNTQMAEDTDEEMEV